MDQNLTSKQVFIKRMELKAKDIVSSFKGNEINDEESKKLNSLLSLEKQAFIERLEKKAKEIVTGFKVKEITDVENKKLESLLSTEKQEFIKRMEQKAKEIILASGGDVVTNQGNTIAENNADLKNPETLLKHKMFSKFLEERRKYLAQQKIKLKFQSKFKIQVSKSKKFGIELAEEVEEIPTPNSELKSDEVILEEEINCDGATVVAEEEILERKKNSFSSSSGGFVQTEDLEEEKEFYILCNSINNKLENGNLSEKDHEYYDFLLQKLHLEKLNKKPYLDEKIIFRQPKSFAQKVSKKHGLEDRSDHSDFSRSL